jgi:hypothetical protein
MGRTKMEEQPSFEKTEEKAAQSKVRAFVQNLAIILVASLAGSGLYALLVGPRNLIGVSNGLFIAGAILLIIGLFPLLNEIFGRSTVSFRLEEGGLDEVLEDERGRSRRGETVTFLFGISGIIVVALSFLVSFAVK